MDHFLHDLSHGVRSLIKSPAFSVIAVVTLALGIGANTAVFSIVNALILRPYPFADLDRIMLVRAAGPKVMSEARIAPADFLDLQRESAAFEDLAAFQEGDASLTGGGDAESLIVCSVTADFFHILGATPERGRTFVVEEGQAGRNQVVVLNHGFWQRRFAADPEIIGKTIEIDGQKATVTGIMPAGFNYPPAVDLWQPLALTPDLRRERNAQTVKGNAFQVVGKLRPNVPRRQANAELRTFSVRLEQQFPESHQERSLTLLGLREEQFSFTGPIFLPLQVAALFVLLLASSRSDARSTSGMITTSRRKFCNQANSFSVFHLPGVVSADVDPESNSCFDDGEQ